MTSPNRSYLICAVSPDGWDALGLPDLGAPVAWLIWDVAANAALAPTFTTFEEASAEFERRHLKRFEGDEDSLRRALDKGK